MKRAYLNRIEVNLNTITKDIYAGDVALKTVLGYSWCSVNTTRRDKLVSYGLDIQDKAIEIVTRWRNDLDYEQQGLYFTYKGQDYKPVSIEVVGLEEEEVKILAVGISKGA